MLDARSARAALREPTPVFVLHTTPTERNNSNNTPYSTPFFPLIPLQTDMPLQRSASRPGQRRRQDIIEIRDADAQDEMALDYDLSTDKEGEELHC